MRTNERTRSTTQCHKAELMHDYCEMHEFGEETLSNAEHHMTKTEDERAERQKFESDAVNPNSSQHKFQLFLHVNLVK